MGEVVHFKRPKLKEKHQGNTLCRNGHHKWQAEKGTPFDVKSGKLVTRLRCQRCGATKTEAR